jgi:hypothetical protein
MLRAWHAVGLVLPIPLAASVPAAHAQSSYRILHHSAAGAGDGHPDLAPGLAASDLDGDGKTDAFAGNVALGGATTRNEVWLNSGSSASELRAAGGNTGSLPVLAPDGVVNSASYARRVAADSLLAEEALPWGSAATGRSTFTQGGHSSQTGVALPVGAP